MRYIVIGDGPLPGIDKRGRNTLPITRWCGHGHRDRWGADQCLGVIGNRLGERVALAVLHPDGTATPEGSER